MNTSRNTAIWFSALIGSLVFFTSSCGGGGSATNNQVTSSPTPTPPVTTPPTASEPLVPLAPVNHVKFVNATTASGLAFQHSYNNVTMGNMVSSGIAIGDYDQDGWLDIYLTQGEAGTNILLKNTSTTGQYSFVDATQQAGVTGETTDKASGTAFVDYDGDNDLDLFVGSVEHTPLRVFQNQGNGQFVDVSASTGLTPMARENTISLTFGDINGDGFVDLFTSHWTFTENELPAGSTRHLWQNNGDGTFVDISDSTLMGQTVVQSNKDFSFSPTFADIDNDGDSDLLIVADNTTSQVLINNGDSGSGVYTYSDVTDRGLISDDAGMGSSVADFDNDGDLDWFVTSISLGDSPNNRPTEEDNAGFNLSGNRFYRNEGNGQFSDQTDTAGVRKGYWGWGSCAADFNNDGYLDIFHVNGMDEPNTNAYLEDPSRLFINNGDGSFTEYAQELGIIDTKSGRGVTCFDGDQDGDIDILVANNRDQAQLFQNDGGNFFNYLNVGLHNNAPNTQAIGARIYVSSEGATQMREIHNGSNYMSHNPSEQHFGLAVADTVTNITVRWPDGVESSRANVASNQRIQINYPDTWSSD